MTFKTFGEAMSAAIKEGPLYVTFYDHTIQRWTVEIPLDRISKVPVK